MVRAVFMDYYGTVVRENGPIAMEVVQRVFEGGNAESPEGVVSVGSLAEALERLSVMG